MPTPRLHREIPLTIAVLRRFGAATHWEDVLSDAVVGSGAADRRPSLDVVPTWNPHTVGGRYFPRRNAIAVYDAHDIDLTTATILHEAAHWRDRLARCGPATGRSRCGYLGDHDRTFYAVLAPLYRARGVPASAIQRVERNYPYPRSLLTQAHK